MGDCLYVSCVLFVATLVSRLQGVKLCCRLVVSVSVGLAVLAVRRQLFILHNKLETDASRLTLAKSPHDVSQDFLVFRNVRE